MQKVKRFPAIDGELGWYETSSSHSISIGRRLKGRHSFDFLIVGGGYTGIAVAHRLAELEPDSQIALVDALEIGQGTSGRNAGFIIDVPHNLDATHQDTAYDIRLQALNNFAIQRLDSFRKKFDIECDWTYAGKYLAAHEESNFGGLTGFAATLDAIKAKYTIFEGQELARRLGTSFYRRAVYTPGNILINPASLIRGLALALPKNVTVFSRSPITSYEFGSPHTAHFLGGEISARQIVLATNSFGEESGRMGSKLAPIFTYASLTEKLSADELQKHFKDIAPWGLTSAHPAGTTVRLTAEKRIFVRNTLKVEPSLRTNPAELDKAWNKHRHSFENRFPHLKQLQFEYTWGGMLCMTLNHQSVFDYSADGVATIAGCNGVGVAKGTYLGYYLADMMCGKKSPELDFIRANNHASWMPPEPLWTIGARVRLAMESQAAGDDV